MEKEQKPNPPNNADSSTDNDRTPEEEEPNRELKLLLRSGIEAVMARWGPCPMCHSRQWLVNPAPGMLVLADGRQMPLMPVSCKACLFTCLLPAVETVKRGSLVQLPPGVDG